jgi:hypothetical protein
MRLVAIATVVFAFTGSAYGQSKDVQVPFLFTQDESLSSTDVQRNIASSDTIRWDGYLTAPITRLEYMLMRMDTRLNEENLIALIKEELTRRFDSPKPKIISETTKGYALYSESHGKVFTGYIVDHLGRPRVPMREACDKVLSHVDMSLPQELLGAIYHNTVLGVLAQKDYSEYTPALRNLVANLVHRVRIVAKTDDGVLYALSCQRASKEAPIVYYKQSFRLREPTR